MHFRIIIACFLTLVTLSSQSQPIKTPIIGNKMYSIFWKPSSIQSFSYQVNGSSKKYKINLPVLFLNGRMIPIVLKNLKTVKEPLHQSNGITEYILQGACKYQKDLSLKIIFQVSPDNPVLRFQYQLAADTQYLLTKPNAKDAITYFSFSVSDPIIKEVRLSQFNERFHATHLTEQLIDERYFQDGSSFMGPIVVSSSNNNSFLAAYEHGSQYPDRFLQFKLTDKNVVSVESVKGNYLNEQQANGFTSVWFEIAAVKGNETQLSNGYRCFVLNYLTQNKESRKPYIFYNTWGRQERVQWTGQKYLSSMNLQQTLKEIDRAHQMGIEVYVLDAGWFKKTGDWEVNTEFFPDELKQVKAKLDEYGMKLGLWFNPTVAALSSQMYQNNKGNQMSWNGNLSQPQKIWETEESVGLCLVSPYWEDFANKLISLTKQLGVSYFKWDAIGQYGCNDAHHYHGTESNSPEQRAQRYAFLQPFYMAKIVDKVCKEAPQCIFDFDITEDGRCVGLQFLQRENILLLTMVLIITILI